MSEFELDDKSRDVGPLPVMSTDSGVGEEGLAPDNQTGQDLEQVSGFSMWNYVELFDNISAKIIEFRTIIPKVT